MVVNAFRTFAALTEAEERDLREGVAEYSDRCRKEEEEAQQKLIEATTPHNWIPNLYEEFEKRNSEYITELGEDIGLMTKLKEKHESGRTYDYARYFINLYACEIEELYGEIEQYREFAKGLKALPG